MVCPACGKRRFVPYVSSADGQTLATDAHGDAIYGRCDREQNCGYHKYPNGVQTGNVAPRTIAPPKDYIRFYKACVFVSTYTPLFTYACKLVGPKKATEVWERYKISSDKDRTIFWQIDAQGGIRTGKTIPYGADGHRIKTDRMPANWLHKSRYWMQYADGNDLQQCYFGEHLLPQYQQAKVVIVESEKTAALMSAYTDPNKWVWLASGGSQGLQNADKNKALAGREVWLCPDNKQYYRWLGIANKNAWHIFSQIELHPVFEGCDILDMVEAGTLGADLIFSKIENENQRLQK